MNDGVGELKDQRAARFISALMFFIARPWLHPSRRVAQGHAGRSQVVVFLLDVPVCVLETQRLDVVGDVGDASVEFLRA